MKLGAMVDAFQQQLDTDEAAALSFEERLGLLVDTEWTAREQRKLERRLRTAKLRYPATLEAVDFTHPRRLNRQQILTLGACAWIAERHNVIVTGPCGIGKSFLACAFVERACRRGFAARYVRMPRLLHELAVGRGDGSYTRLLARLARLDLLAIDDWMLAPLRPEPRHRSPGSAWDLLVFALLLNVSSPARSVLACPRGRFSYCGICCVGKISRFRFLASGLPASIGENLRKMPVRMIAYDTYAALKEAGAGDEAARTAAAETGELYVNVRTTTARLNVLIGVNVVGFGIVIAGLFQIALRLP